MNRIIYIMACMVISITSYSQDTIYTNDGYILNVHIVDVSKSKVKFQLPWCDSSYRLTMYLVDIDKIKYSDGKTVQGNAKNPRKLYPLGLSIGTAIFITVESGFLYLNMDYFFLPQFSVEGNVGITDFEAPYYSIGCKYYFKTPYKSNRLTPYVGALIGSEYYDPVIQIPIGLNYIFKSGLNISFGYSYMIYYKDDWKESLLELKVGWRF